MRKDGWIKLASPWMDDEEQRAAAEVFSSGRLVTGPRGVEFEEKIKDIVGVRHAHTMNSGTMALFAVLKSLGLGPSDEVIIPALTFPAAAECTVLTGATPVFVDVSRESFNLDSELVAEAITDRTRAVIAIDQFGVPANYPDIERLLAGREIFLIEDSACALGSSLGGKACGAFGKAAVLSFHPRKIITTGEGGMVLTDDDDLASRIEKLRNHGRDSNGSFASAGLNLRMGEVEAALGLAQLRKLESILRKRREIADLYTENLSGLLELQQVPEGGVTNFQTYAAVLPGEGDERTRDNIIEEMHKRKIELQIASYNVPQVQPYVRFAGERKYPVARKIHGSGLALPIHPLMDEKDVRSVCNALKDVLGKPAG